ncbi:RNase H domain-containing protein [Caerostris extrusa]|uniref:RNase H domain-containing protein n=1 Tax=Caerostris extrusa TaxID=172846 RepID=A0AAV4W5B9_CAEEX|nr:RNase H domain-containing protein [Caerostris extrusa]
MSGQEILSDKIKRLALQFLIKQYANHSFSPLMVNNELQILDKDENTLKNSLQNYNCSPEHLLTLPIVPRHDPPLCEIFLQKFRFQNRENPVSLIVNDFSDCINRFFSDHYIIATDASKSHVSTSIAGISCNQSFSYRINPINSVFTAEVLAICVAIDELAIVDKDILILSDSFLALNSLKNLNIHSTYAIQRLASKLFPSYKEVKSRINDFVHGTLNEFTRKQAEQDMRDEEILYYMDSLTSISLFSYTFDTIIYQLMNKRFQEEYKTVVTTIIKNHVEKEKMKGRDNPFFEVIEKHLDGAIEENNSLSDGEESYDSITNIPEKKRKTTEEENVKSKEKKDNPFLSVDRPCHELDNKIKEYVSSSKLLTDNIMAEQENNTSFEEDSDAESLLSFGNISVDSVSSVHTSDLSSLDDTISVHSDDGEVKHMPIAEADKIYLGGKFHEIYAIRKKSEELKQKKSTTVKTTTNSLSTIKTHSNCESGNMHEMEGRNVDFKEKQNTSLKNLENDTSSSSNNRNLNSKFIENFETKAKCEKTHQKHNAFVKNSGNQSGITTLKSNKTHLHKFNKTCETNENKPQNSMKTKQKQNDSVKNLEKQNSTGAESCLATRSLQRKVLPARKRKPNSKYNIYCTDIME